MTAPHPVTVSLNFTPSFYHKHLGVTYGEPYYFEPRYREQVECAENRFLYELCLRCGCGSVRWCSIFDPDRSTTKSAAGRVQTSESSRH